MVIYLSVKLLKLCKAGNNTSHPAIPSHGHLEAKTNAKFTFCSVLNHKKMMTEAADNLYRMFWISIHVVEDMDRSIELLEHQLGLEKESLKVITVNKNEEKDSVSQKSRSALASLVGIDRWLYDYGK